MYIDRELLLEYLKLDRWLISPFHAPHVKFVNYNTENNICEGPDSRPLGHWKNSSVKYRCIEMRLDPCCILF